MLGELSVLLLLAAPPEPPAITAPVAIVADLDSEEILMTKGASGPHSIASITKLLALRVVFASGLALDEETTMAKEDWEHTVGGARTRLVRGRAYKNRDLVHAALLGSDNRAVVALGRSVGLDHATFVKAMNAEAKQLGILGAHFEDVTGIDHGNVASPLGVVTLLEAAMAVPEIAEISRKAQWQTSARERSGRPLLYRNTNLLAREETRDVLVGKTGFNSSAGWCVATALRLKNGRRVAIVVLGTKGKHLRFRDARRLAKWAETLSWVPPTPRDNRIDG